MGGSCITGQAWRANPAFHGKCAAALQTSGTHVECALLRFFSNPVSSNVIQFCWAPGEVKILSLSCRQLPKGGPMQQQQQQQRSVPQCLSADVASSVLAAVLVHATILRLM